MSGVLQACPRCGASDVRLFTAINKPGIANYATVCTRCLDLPDSEFRPSMREHFEGWQEDRWVHPLTCGSCSTPLVFNGESDDELSLRCSSPTCNYQQQVKRDSTLWSLLAAHPALQRDDRTAFIDFGRRLLGDL